MTPLIIIFFLGSLSSFSQSSFYSKLTLGVSVNPSLTMNGNSNDRGSFCDEYINPLYASIAGCTSSERGVGDGYSVDFDSTTGRSGSISLGVQILPALGLELEHHYAIASYNDTSPVNNATGVNRDKLQDEIVKSDERLGDLKSSSFYGNIVFSFLSKSRLTPYLGAGAGLSRLHAEYASVWARNFDPNLIKTGENLPNADEVKTNLSGTVSSAFGPLESSSFSWKAFSGFDYELLDRTFFTFKVQFIQYGTLESDELVWDPLRSHPPNLRKDGSEPVKSISTFENINAISLNLGIRYNFL